MSTRPETARSRTPLSREVVLAEAVRLADEEGIGALSMRKLAERLGVQAMSLYNHVGGKDDLRNGMVDLVVREIELPEGPEWKSALRRSAISAHEILVAHRWAPGLLLSAASDARLRWMEAVLRTFRQAGFSAALTDHAYHALDSHVTGFTLWQASLPFETRAELLDMAEAFFRDFPEDEYPYVAEHGHQHLRDDAPSGATEFAFGLDLLLDGLERLLESE